MFGSIFRILRPIRLIKRAALIRGVFGGDRLWLGVGAVIFVAGQVKSLFGRGEPKSVYVEQLDQGQRVVLAHEPSRKRRRKRR